MLKVLTMRKGLMMTHREVVYIPPDQRSIHTYAQQVCDTLAKRCDPSFAEPEVVTGFANFLSLVAHLEAKYRGQREGAFDNDSLTR